MSKFKVGDRAVVNKDAFRGVDDKYREEYIGSIGTITTIKEKFSGSAFDVDFNPDVEWSEGAGPWPLFDDELDLVSEESGDK